MLWRGSEVPAILNDHPSIEYWTKKKLDVSSESDRKLIYDYLITQEGVVDGRKVQAF